MSARAPDPTRRFSDRVADYVHSRPGYPDALVRTLRAEGALPPDAVVADVGSGTGISTALLLSAGYTVFAVEPNAAMRAEAERRLGTHRHFWSVDGSAEATRLGDHSVDLVTAAQAFHWFRADLARREFARILRPHGSLALFWNSRLPDATPFLRAYEALLQTFGTDYRQIQHKRLGDEQFRECFGGPYRAWTFPNAQVFDLDGLQRRLLSSSYVPAAGHARHAPMLEELRRIFEAHARDGWVQILYDTELYLGRIEVSGATSG